MLVVDRCIHHESKAPVDVGDVADVNLKKMDKELCQNRPHLPDAITPSNVYII